MSGQQSFEPLSDDLANDDAKTQASGLMEQGQKCLPDHSCCK